MNATEKQIRQFYDRLAMLPDYRAEGWVLDKRDIALLCRYSIRLCSGHPVELNDMQERGAHALTYALDHDHVRISREHENAGLAWLWSQYNKGWLGSRELMIMRRFWHFSLVGVETKQLGLHWASVPIWRVHGDGGTFTYEQWSWQSGRKPVLVN
jgi:hypothetical protein